MIGILWLVLGLFVAVIASIPARLSIHHFRKREWEAAIGNLVISIMLGGISAAQFAYAAQRL